MAMKRTMVMAAATLPEELVIEILLRLPSKALIRFKRVCKSLYSTIKTSIFISKHFLINRDDPYIVIVNCDGTHILSSYNELVRRGRSSRPRQQPMIHRNFLCTCRRGHSGNYRLYDFHCVCCCDGFMLVNYTRNYNDYAMWNPSTGDTKLIPKHPYPHHFDGVVCGIGFDSKNNEYKPFFAHSVLERMEIEMYSFKTKQWTNLIHDQSELGIIDVFIYGWESARRIVYANGIPHWIGFSRFLDKIVIISFDMSSDKILTTPFPNDINFKPRPYHILFNDSLALVNHHCHKNGDFSFDTWVLGEYGDKDSWSMLFTIPSLRPLKGICTIVGFWNKTKIFVLCQEEEEDDKAKLFLYDMLTKQALDLRICGTDLRVMTCPQTLFPLVSK